MVSSRSGCIVIDRGLDWLGRPYVRRPEGIFITHAHVDHLDGLRRGAPCPVYATASTGRATARWPIADRRVLRLHDPVSIAGLRVEAWPVEHSHNAPAVGFRVTCGRRAVFYVPDIARLPHSRRALEGVSLYVGDGATMTRPLVRRRGHVLIGHATIAAQLEWCAAAGVPRAIFTHCGSGIVRRPGDAADRAVRALAQERGCAARLASDGMTLRI